MRVVLLSYRDDGERLGLDGAHVKTEPMMQCQGNRAGCTCSLVPLLDYIAWSTWERIAISELEELR